LINLNNSFKAHGGLKMDERKAMNLRLKNKWEIVCKGADGLTKWREIHDNLIVNVGLQDLLTKYLQGSAYTAAWYVGIKEAGTAVAADTMASHSSWVENVDYTESVRQTLTLGTATTADPSSVDNSSNKATFSINDTATIAGAFMVTDSTKSGTSGTLYGVVDFGSTRSVISGDTLEITVTLTSGN
tara:strand:- start:393 stop:950 length:558 start_codon:yes stop_codon:yes gene_type:complete